MSEYPVMKTQTPVGKVLNFQNDGEKYQVIESDGIYYGEKGYTLVCVCIESKNKAMIGEQYSFDDRVFRAYNENNIKIEDGPMLITTVEQYKAAQEELEALALEFAKGEDVLDEEGNREKEISLAMKVSPFELCPDTGKAQRKGTSENQARRSDSAHRLLLVAKQNNELGEDFEAQTVDLLRNLIHFSKDYGFTLDECLEQAKQAYEEDV